MLFTVRNVSSFFLALSVFGGVLLSGCKPNKPNNEKEQEGEDSTALVSDQLVKVDNILFSLPSPIQIAMLIKKTGANYDKGLLNTTKTVKNYTTNFSKAINLGVYGADMGYVTIYDQTQDALSYLNAIKILSESLGISGAFEKSTMERFEKNIGTKDSILAIVGDAFRSSDTYLKDNQRKDISALIITGGWIEGLYYASLTAKKNPHQELINRIGEQKTTLANLIKMVSEFSYNDDGSPNKEFSDLANNLIDLSNIFEGIEFTYTYEQPSIDTVNKITVINSSSNVKITPEHLNQITEKIQSIRNQIIK